VNAIRACALTATGKGNGMPENGDARQNTLTRWRTPLLLGALVIVGGIVLFLILGPPPPTG
jgi:hypothetical protein